MTIGAVDTAACAGPAATTSHVPKIGAASRDGIDRLRAVRMGPPRAGTGDHGAAGCGQAGRGAQHSPAHSLLPASSERGVVPHSAAGSDVAVAGGCDDAL